MLWLQRSPNGKMGFGHRWRVKWSPYSGRISQMIVVRLILIACKMEQLLLSSLTKRLFLFLFLYFFLCSFRLVYSRRQRQKQRCSVFFANGRNMFVQLKKGNKCWIKSPRFVLRKYFITKTWSTCSLYKFWYNEDFIKILFLSAAKSN